MVQEKNFFSADGENPIPASLRKNLGKTKKTHTKKLSSSGRLFTIRMLYCLKLRCSILTFQVLPLKYIARILIFSLVAEIIRNILIFWVLDGKRKYHFFFLPFSQPISAFFLILPLVSVFPVFLPSLLASSLFFPLFILDYRICHCYCTFFV